MTPPVVAFDEAGNTGQNLLDRDQPIFVSAGVHLSDEDIGELRDLLEWREGEELHFVKLRKSRAGSDRVERLLNSRFAVEGHAKFMAIHKPYMVTTKIVDFLVEEVAYRDGIDLYERGGHLAMANMYYFLMPHFCGEELRSRLLDLFVAMIRTGHIRPIRKFYETVREMMDVAPDETFASSLAPLLKSANYIGDILENRAVTDLDPAVPAFVSVAAAWDQSIDGPWSVVHDESKPIAFDKDILESYMTDEFDVDHFRADVEFALPLAATGIAFADSAMTPPLQIADIFASAGAHYLKGVVDMDRRDDVWTAISESKVLEASVGAVWPAPLFTPTELGMEDFDGRHLEKANELIDHAMREKYGPDWATRRLEEKKSNRR